MIQYDIKYNEWNERGQPRCTCTTFLFNVVKDFVSHNALSDTRRQHIFKWTKWHIEWPCRSYCNSIWVISRKSRISFYLWMTSCGLPFTVEEQSHPQHRSRLPISQLQLCYCHSTNTLGADMKTVLQKWTRKKQNIKFFTYRHCERKVILPLLSPQESKEEMQHRFTKSEQSPHSPSYFHHLARPHSHEFLI